MIADSPRIHWMRAQQCRFWETAIEYPTDEIYGHASLPVAKWPTAAQRAENASHRLDWGITNYDAYDEARKAPRTGEEAAA